MSQYQNQFGENVVALYIHNNNEWVGEEHWQIIKLPENSFDARQYGKIVEFKRTNSSGTQGWVCGRLDLEELRGIRDMLSAAIRELEDE
ncbi:hypothetical protein Wildcat_59 [Mycobacterium phage Wildcat]|uniref:Uncharacterized protein n=3 Tax=Mycobacterium virus Wildcat TaxID=1993859 RepID=Q19Y01_9CAUD|nr:hypothetical protein Wildcat_59 [Mycobacterium phage Wildcat]ABE67664.1 hypothetical protein Wildcat_59 [Mycobacterium phage Wildcat]AQT25731.1 hypothetical protein EniyanLRS_56 [Mycobacterium phage EniyanLRS]QGJ89949.1 hypothetical protein PBI_MARYV_59 [Mycobacterium phage MaryV]